MYIYENHMGGLFASDRELSYEECYCETCGDSDWLIGEADTREEVLDRKSTRLNSSHQI